MRNITTNECASDDERKASQGKCCKSKMHTGYAPLSHAVWAKYIHYHNQTLSVIATLR